MGSPSGGNTGGGGRTDAGPNRTTAYKAGVGNINEKGQKTKTTFTKEDDNRDNNKVVTPKKKTNFKSVTKEVLNPKNKIQKKKRKLLLSIMVVTVVKVTVQNLETTLLLK